MDSHWSSSWTTLEVVLKIRFTSHYPALILWVKKINGFPQAVLSMTIFGEGSLPVLISAPKFFLIFFFRVQLKRDRARSSYHISLKKNNPTIKSFSFECLSNYKKNPQSNTGNKIQKLTLSRFDSNSWFHVGWKGIRLDKLPAKIC